MQVVKKINSVLHPQNVNEGKLSKKRNFTKFIETYTTNKSPVHKTHTIIEMLETPHIFWTFM